MGMINLYKTYQTKSEQFYNYFLVGHIADKDVYNHAIILTYRTENWLGKNPSSPLPKIIKLISIRETENLWKWLYKTNTILQLSS